MSLSIQKMVSDGTLSTVVLGVQYLQRNDMYMRIAGVETPQNGAPSGYTWSFLDSSTIRVLPAVQAGVEVVVYRRTDLDAMYNIYSQNAQFDESTIDENNQQLLYIAQEYYEQGIPAQLITGVDYVREDYASVYYRLKLTDGSYTAEFPVPKSDAAGFEALRRTYADAGLVLVVGSFETGGTLNSRADVLLHNITAKAYAWTGAFPHVVTTGTDPTVVGSGYVPRTDVVLRAEVGMRRFTSAQAPSQSYYDGELIYLTDVGYVFKFESSRYLIDGQSASEITFNDNLHILVTAGGMLQFDEFDKLRGVQSANSARFAAAIKDRTTPVTVDCYGDSITFGQALADTANATNKIGVATGFGDGSTHEHWQFNSHYPYWVLQEISGGMLQGGSVNNYGYSGDRALTGYLRHRVLSGSMAATVMYGVNDCLYATANGVNPDGLTTNSLYSVEQYSHILRIFVAKQIMQGKCVTILGTPPFASLSGFDGTQLAAQKLTRAYNAAAKAVAAEFGCRYVDVNQDIAQQYGVLEFTQEGTHPDDVGLKVLGTRIAASVLSVETENRVQSGATLIANPTPNAMWARSGANILPNASCTPSGATDDSRTTMNVDSNGITIPFYAETDGLVLYPQGICASGVSFSIELDHGAVQSDLWMQRQSFSGKPASIKVLSSLFTFTYESVDIFDDTKPSLVVANRGWHTLTIKKVSGSGSLLLDSLRFVGLDTALNNQVTAFAKLGPAFALDASVSRNIESVSVPFPNETAVTFAVPMLNANYTVVVDTNETAADPVSYAIRYKTVNGFGVTFWKLTAGVWALFAPTSATVRVIGGR